MTSDPPRVYMFQPSIQHYRIALWDGLVERGRGLYDFHAIGPMQNGEAFGGGRRSYLREMPQTDHFLKRFTIWRWPQAVAIVEREKPAVVIFAANPRNLTCWKLPAACRRAGAACIGHSKVHSFSGLPEAITSRIKRRFFRHFDLMICYGLQSRQEVLALGIADDRLYAARNTIDTRRIFQDESRIRERGRDLRRAAGVAEGRLLLCIGRMEADKRHDDLLKAWPVLRERVPDLKMALVSGGPLLDEIRARAAALDAQRIIVTGRVPEGDDYAWIAAADVCVFPGAVGLAINQALALGTPTVIADERGADAEIVEHGRTGWRFERGNIAAMVDAVGRVFSDAANGEVATVREQARKLMREDVTIDNMADVFHQAIVRGIGMSREMRARS